MSARAAWVRAEDGKHCGAPGHAPADAPPARWLFIVADGTPGGVVEGLPVRVLVQATCEACMTALAADLGTTPEGGATV